MRRRILLSTLLAVAVTAVALGLPLGVTALKLVEDLTAGGLSTRAQQIATLSGPGRTIATTAPADPFALDPLF